MSPMPSSSTRSGLPRRRPASRQAIALVVIWTHGCLGIYFWLRFRPWFPQRRALAADRRRAAAGPGAARLRQRRPDGGRVAALRPSPTGRPRGDRGGLARKARGWYTSIYVVFAGAARPGPRSAHRSRRGANGATFSRSAIRRRGGARPEGPQRAGGKPACRHSASCRVRRPWPMLNLPRQVSRTASIDSRRPERRAGDALARIQAEPDVRLACQLHPVARSRRHAAALMPEAQRRRGTGRRSPRPAASRRSPSCSATFAVSQRSPTTVCPSTPSSCSTAISPWSARRWNRPAAAWTSSSATAPWRFSALDTTECGGLPAGDRRRRGHPRRSRPAVSHELADELQRAAAGRHRHPCRPGDRRRDGLLAASWASP